MIAPLPRLYGELAWIWPLLSPPQDYTEEASRIRALLSEHVPNRTSARILELGAGGGHTLSHLAGVYDVTAVDLSDAMLANCRRLVPAAHTIMGDMRSVRLEKRFDAVLIHDAIDYMTTREDLIAALATAAAHLRPGGLLLVAPTYLAESFDDHETESDARCEDGIEIAYVSHVQRMSATTIELTLVIMIRKNGELSIEEDHHSCGLFDVTTWRTSLMDAGFEVIREPTLSMEVSDPFEMFVAAKR